MRSTDCIADSTLSLQYANGPHPLKNVKVLLQRSALVIKHCWQKLGQLMASPFLVISMVFENKICHSQLSWA